MMPLGGTLGLRYGAPRQHDHELLTALAANHIGLPKCLPTQLGETYKDLIPGLVAQGVVDRLEVIHAEPCLSPRPLDMIGE